jgi:hypothetical protein
MQRANGADFLPPMSVQDLQNLFDRFRAVDRRRLKFNVPAKIYDFLCH